MYTTLIASQLAKSTIYGSNPVLDKQKPNDEKFAVLLIDAAYYDKRNFIDLDQELQNMGEVLEEANRKSVPVFEITFKAGYITRGYKRPTESHPKLKAHDRGDWIKITKEDNNSFKGTNLGEKLKEKGITSVILMGFNQDYCVKDAAIEARRRGYKVYTSFRLMQGKKDFMKNEEYDIEKASRFYRSETTLVENYLELPIFK